MENKKPRGRRGKDYSTSEMLDFVIFLSSGEKTKNEIKEGLPKIFEGREGDPIPGFVCRVKQALTKEGKSGLSTRVVSLKDKKKICYYSLNISEDEAADRLENFKSGRGNTHTTPVVKKPKKERVVEVEEETTKENPIVPILKQVLEFFESPEKYTPEQVKELTEKLPDDLYDYWFDTWADLQREKFEEKLRLLKRS